MSFEETELRLGLPGNNDNNNNIIMIRKRGFDEEEDQQTILKVMPDLKLNLTSSHPSSPKYVLLRHLFSIHSSLSSLFFFFFLFVIP